MCNGSLTLILCTLLYYNKGVNAANTTVVEFDSAVLSDKFRLVLAGYMNTRRVRNNFNAGDAKKRTLAFGTLHGFHTGEGNNVISTIITNTRRDVHSRGRQKKKKK